MTLRTVALTLVLLLALGTGGITAQDILIRTSQGDLRAALPVRQDSLWHR